MEQVAELSVMVGIDGREDAHPALVRNPADAPVRIAVDDLVGAMRASGVEGLDGASFVLRSERLGTVLDDEETLVSAGVRDGDVLVLVGRSAALDAVGLLVGERARRRTEARRAQAATPGRQSRRRRGWQALAVAAVAAAAVAAVGVAWLQSRSEPLTARFAGGRWVQLATFRGPQHAHALAARLRAHGIRAQTIASSDIAELYPGWQVVAVGPLPSAVAQRRTIQRARRAGTGGGLARTYTPATVRATPATLAGDYRGMLTRTDPRAPSARRRVPAHLVLHADGSGAVRFGRRGCLGRLLAAKAVHAIVVWRDHTKTPGCPSHAEWVTKLYGGKLVILWRQPRREPWMEGRLPRSG